MPSAGSQLQRPSKLEPYKEYRFQPRVHCPRSPKTKGKVERPMGDIRSNFFQGLSFSSLRDLNAQARTWLDHVAEHRAEEAAAASVGYLEFLHRLVEEELAGRFERYVETRTRLANFPFRKTLEPFDFDAQPGVDKRAVMELSSMVFVERATNVILLGLPGVSKTHLAVGLGMEAITSNKSYGAWGDIIDDHVVAVAILDRLVHHSVTINIRGESYRPKEKLKAGVRTRFPPPVPMQQDN